MDRAVVSQKIKDILATNFAGVDGQTGLFAQLNSLALVQLVTNLETAFQIEIDNLEIYKVNFDNIETMVNLVCSKIDDAKL